MRSCEKCLENNWSYEYIDGWVRATCPCGATVEFEAKKKVVQELSQGAPCRKCQKPVYLKNLKPSAKSKRKAYYFTAYWRCSGCRTIYMDEQFKVLNQEAMEANIRASLELGKFV